MKHELFWKNPGYKVRSSLSKAITCKYLIVGGGITGVATAHYLQKLGASGVVLIEKSDVASGATGKAAGTLVTRGESDLVGLLKTHGRSAGERYWREIRNSMNELISLIKTEKIDCDAEPQDTLYCGATRWNHSFLQQEYLAEKHLEYTTQFLYKEKFQKELNTPHFKHGFLSAGHGLSVNPLKFTQNFSTAIEKKGVKIYENTPLLDYDNGVAQTPGGTIEYKKLVLAIDADNTDQSVKTQKSSIIITKPVSEDNLKRTGMHRRKIVFDSHDKYEYFKVTRDSRFLFGFGTLLVRKKHRPKTPHIPHLDNIQKFMKTLFPYLKLIPEYAWSGTFGVTSNYEPHFIFKKDIVEMAGAGSQVTCFMAAKHIAHCLLKKKSSVSEFFPNP